MLLQTTASECGLACVASIAAAHGHEIELSELRTRFTISLRGTTLADLMEIAAMLNLSSRPLRLELNELSQLSLPCILHWDINHFVVLCKVLRDRIVIHDPALGERTVPISEVSEHFTGVALELFPSEAFRRRQATPSMSWRQLFARVVGWKRSLVQMLLLAFALEIFALVSPFFVQWTVDEVVVSGDHDLLTLLGLGFLMLLVVRAVTEAARGLAGLALSTQLNVQSSSRVMGHLIRLPIQYFETRILGDIVSRFQALRSIQETVTGSLIEVLLDGLCALVTAVIMLL
jgi:ATP-binding cassette, subfamily B, bacterial CvaB/MchF/RaxB